MAGSDYGKMIPDLWYFICRYCAPEWNIVKSPINYVNLTYLIEGHATYTVNGSSYEAYKGDLICIPAGSVRQAESDKSDPMACYAANFFLTDLKGRPMDLPFPVLNQVGIREDLLSRYHELNAQWLLRKPGYAVKARSLMLDILYYYLKLLYYQEPFEKTDPRIQRIIHYIYENYTRKITADDLAGLVGLNTSYLGTLFKASTGYHIKDFINRIRIHNAENLIVGGSITLREAAARSGFDDFFYFSKVFKQIRGYPPSQVVISSFKGTSAP